MLFSCGGIFCFKSKRKQNILYVVCAFRTMAADATNSTMRMTMKKFAIFMVFLLCACAVSIGVMTHCYKATDDYKSNHLRAGYIINGVRCYDMDYDTAVKTVSDQWNAADILVTGTMDEPLFTVKNIDCTYDIAKKLPKIKKNHPIMAALNYYLNFPASVRIPMHVTSYTKKFKEDVTSAEFLNLGAVTETRDAYVDLKDPEFPIVKEVYGSKPDTEKFFQDILTCIEIGQTVFQYREEDYVAVPEVKSDDPELLAYQDFCRQYLHQKITYDLGEDSYTIPTKKLAKMMRKDLSGKARRKAVTAFVARIAERYDNVGKNRKFKSLTGKTITIENSDYGWSVDQEAETEQLMKDIRSHEDVSREPVWATRGYGDYSLNIGKTYIDIDVSRQKLIYFRDGERKFTSDVVTGCRNTGTTTPTGLFSILNKGRNIVLKGRNANGSKYTSFVNYWMAFLGSSYGIHDASWRSSFGGDIWVSSGSHGCVNMPPSKMPRLYDLVDYGTPVIIHY